MVGAPDKVKPGTVISREEFTKILLDAGQAILAGNEAKTKDPQLSDADAYGLWSCLGQDARQKLVQVLKNNGVSDPGPTLDNVRSMALQLEASNPELANDVRQSIALVHEAASPYLAKVNAWFDQTIDRVSARFTKYTHYVTLGVATVVVLSVQLDIIAVVDRLSIDDKLRDGVVTSAINDVQAPGTQPPAPQAGSQGAPQTANGASSDAVPKLSTQPYYDALSAAGLISLPSFDRNGSKTWLARLSVNKIPGMVIAILLVSLGAPFWYNILKNLLGLRSALAKNDDAQRLMRQTTQAAAPDTSAVTGDIPVAAPAWLKGEQGDLGARG